MDFDQLLKTETGDVSNPEPLATEPEILSSFDDQAVASIPAEHAARPVRHTWPTYVIAASALAAGLIAGVNLTSHLKKPTAPHSIIASSNETITPQVGMEYESPKPATNPQQAALVQNAAPDPVYQTEKSSRKTMIKREKDEYLGSSGLANVTSSEENLASQSSLHRTPQPAFLELLPKSRDVFSTHAIPEITLASIAPSASTGNITGDEEGTGAVRQALGQAAKKTGSFMSKVGTSLKRVF
jgi:hypothetical protein